MLSQQVSKWCLKVLDSNYANKCESNYYFDSKIYDKGVDLYKFNDIQWMSV